jgi:hypothetical protein
LLTKFNSRISLQKGNFQIYLDEELKKPGKAIPKTERLNDQYKEN